MFQQNRDRKGAAAVAACVAALSLTAASCTSPQAIGAFAESAQKALTAGEPLFEDLHASCVRRETARPGEPILPLFVPPGSKLAPKPAPELAACDRFASQAQALGKVSDVLTGYFRAIQQLAAFNTTAVATANQNDAQAAATAAQLSLVQIDSVAQLAGLITRVFTEHYQHSRLLADMLEADPAVANITEGFQSVISNYLVFLQEEQQTLTARYQQVGDVNQPATLLLLNHAYTDDVAEIQRRRTEAENYSKALGEIREGHHQLIEDAKHMSAKELSLVLQPYTSELNTLAPLVQK